MICAVSFPAIRAPKPERDTITENSTYSLLRNLTNPVNNALSLESAAKDGAGQKGQLQRGADFTLRILVENCGNKKLIWNTVNLGSFLYFS